MTRTLLRAGALSCALLASTSLTTPAHGQSVPPPPVRQAVDENGVDMALGTFNVSSPDLTIGAPGHGLSYSREWRGQGWRDNLAATINTDGVTTTVSIAGASSSFSWSGTAYVSKEGNGATLVRDYVTGDHTYTTADGTVAVFAPANGQYDRYGSNVGWARHIATPNGNRLTYHYVVGQWCPLGYWTGSSCTAPLASSVRLQSVTNSLGYQLKLTYASNTLTDHPSLQPWYSVTEVAAINNAVEYCDPIANSCALTNNWPSVTYSRTGDIETVADDTGTLRSFRYNTNNRIIGLRHPGATSDTTTIAYGTDNRVSSVNHIGITYFTYNWLLDGNTRYLTRYNNLWGSRAVSSHRDTFVVQRVTNELGQSTYYNHDINGRVVRVTAPEGNYTHFTYDTRGNVTQTQSVPKTGSGLPTITTSASYDASCTNPRTCNQPNSRTDALGRVTDYTYDATHGGLLTVTAPAPSGSGTRPQARTIWSALQAYARNSAGSIVASGTNVHLPTTLSACATGSAPSCLGTADEVRTTISYGPQTAGTPNNLLPVGSTSGNGSGTLAATATITYDAVGNVASVDGPLAGTADTSTFRYDAARRPVGTVSPDPDGGGSLLRRAQRTTYGATGLVTRVERGTVNGMSDPDWAALAPLQTVDTTYDATFRPVRQTLSGGGTVQAVQDVSYDALGRPECSATRMNPAAWGTLTGACALQTAGSHGPDRISRTVYDEAGQVTQAQTAYGTADQATVATSTYTANGQVETVTDGEGNRTTYVYDGHDRLSRTRMPSPTTDGVSSTTDYEELGYDANGNVTSRRLRDGTSIAYSYDNLNRTTAKDLPGSDPTVTYGYDLLGRMTSAATPAFPSMALAFAYDALGRQSSEVGPLGTVGYQYDLAGNRTRITYPDADYMTYVYNNLGEMTSLREPDNDEDAALAYDNLGRRVSVAYRGGSGTAFTYDAASRLATLTQNLAGTGNDLALGFSYNPAGQIVASTRSNDGYAFTGHANINRTDTVNGLNQVVTTGATGVTHDARGNVSAIGGAAYGYDSENRLVSAPGGVALSYDALGRLFEVSSPSGTRRFLYEDDRLIAEYDGAGTLQGRYMYGPGANDVLVASVGGLRNLHADERGSIVATSDAAGNLVGPPGRYDDYGNPQGTLAGRFGYTGQAWLPELGMWYYRARMYNPALGRFMQTDPIGYAGGMNLYAYVGGDPVNATDPSGLCAASDTAHSRGNCVRPIHTGSLTGRPSPSSMVSSFAGPQAQAGPSMRSGGGLASAAASVAGSGGAGGGRSTPPSLIGNASMLMSDADYDPEEITINGARRLADFGDAVPQFRLASFQPSVRESQASLADARRNVSRICGTAGPSEACTRAQREYLEAHGRAAREYPLPRASGPQSPHTLWNAFKQTMNLSGCAFGIAGTFASEGLAYYISGGYALYGCAMLLDQ